MNFRLLLVVGVQVTAPLKTYGFQHSFGWDNAQPASVVPLAIEAVWVAIAKVGMPAIVYLLTS